MTSYIQLNYWDLAIASVLVLANAGLSLALKLQLARGLIIAALRMTAQLMLVGYILTTLFSLVSPFWTALAALFMIAFAGREVVARQEKGFGPLLSYGLGTASMLMAVSLVTLFALNTQIRPDPWYDPRYALPLLGMILGNTMTGVSLGLQTLTRGAQERRLAIEAQLALGAERHQAMLPVTRDALRTAMMPIINSMSACGLVALPGMMTGQILAGVPPLEAVKYQLLVMFLIAGGTGLGAVTAVMSGVHLLTDSRHRLRLDRLAQDGG
jgi:putative ABC transport system permease protein